MNTQLPIAITEFFRIVADPDCRHCMGAGVVPGDPVPCPCVLVQFAATPEGETARRMAAERRNMRALLNALGDRLGVWPIYTHDGEETERTRTVAAAIAVVSSTGEGTVHCGKLNPETNKWDKVVSILFVMGNSPEELVADYSWYLDDPLSEQAKGLIDEITQGWEVK